MKKFAKHIGKRSLALLLALLMCVTLLPMSAFAEERPVKFSVDVFSPVSETETTHVIGEVYDDYSAKLFLPAGNITGTVGATVTMTDVDSLGVSGTKTHTIGPVEVIKHDGMLMSDVLKIAYSMVDPTAEVDPLYGFQGATITANITPVEGEKKTAVYTLTGKDGEEGGRVIEAATNTEATRAAWQVLTSNISTETQEPANSYVEIAKGSWLQIGKEKLVFEDSFEDDALVVDPSTDGKGLVEKIQEAVTLKDVEYNKLAFSLKAGTKLAVSSSVATLDNDVTVNVTVPETQWAAIENMHTLSGIRAIVNGTTTDGTDALKTLFGMVLTPVKIIDDAENVTVDMAFTKPDTRKAKFWVDVSSELANKEVTHVTGTVYDDYNAELVLPNAQVSASNVTFTIGMQDVASLNMAGIHTYSYPIQTGLDVSVDANPADWFENLYGFKGATITANITPITGEKDQKTAVYTLTGSEFDRQHSEAKVITATTESTEATRAAWQALTANVVGGSNTPDNSFVTIKNGSWLQIGNEKLVFEDNVDDLVVDPSDTNVSLVENIKNHVKVITAEDNKIAFGLKAGTVLAVSESKAELKNDVEAIVAGITAEDLGITLSDLRKIANGELPESDDLIKTLIGYIEAPIAKLDGKNVVVNMVFTCSEHTRAEAVRENEVAATCKDAGSYDEVVYCSACGKELSRTTKTIEKLTTHTSTEAVRENEVAAECGKAGSHDEVVYCAVCGVEMSRTTVTDPATGDHTPDAAMRENEVAATCGRDGSYDEVIYCAVCGIEISSEHKTIPATGEHNYVNGTCTVCGAADPNYNPGGNGGNGGGTEINPNPNPLGRPLPFTDVKEENKGTGAKGDWFAPAVRYMYEHKDAVTGDPLISGTDTTTFSPNSFTTRGQLVAILWRIEGRPEATLSTFADVPETSYYAKAIGWASANGIVSGYDEKTFRPDRNVSRQEAAQILYKYASYKGYDVTGAADLSKYTDNGSVADWAEVAMKWANEEGLISGRSATLLAPTGTTKRCEAAQILMEFCEGYKVFAE